MLRLTPWRRAPFLLLRSPAVVTAVAAASAVLVLVVASPTLFVSAVGGAAIRSDVVDGCPFGVGMTIVGTTPIPGAGSGDDTFERRDSFVEDIGRRTPGTAERVVTMQVASAQATSGKERPGDGQVQLMARTGAEHHVRWLQGGPGDGVWLPDRAAELLQVGAGDDLTVDVAGTPIATHVDGVFEDLAYSNRSSFWCSTERSFEPFGSYVPPPVALLSHAELTRLLAQAGQTNVVARFEVPPDPDGLPLPVATDAASTLQRAVLDVRTGHDPDTDPFAEGGMTATVGLPDSVAHALRVGDAVRPLVQTVAAAAFVIALLVVAAAGRTWSDARAAEVRLLVSKGAPPSALSLKAALEMAPATIAGGAVGFWLARVLVLRLGPSPLLGADAARRSVAVAVVAVAGGLALLAVTSVRAVSVVERKPARRARRWSALPWELALLASAAFAFAQLRSPAGRVRTVAGASYPADALIVAFPLLLLCGGGALAARALHRLLPRLRHRGTSLPLAPLLAIRRLGASGPAALGLVVGAAVSIGIVVYAGIVSASAEATVVAKATLGAGSDLVVFPGTLHEVVPDTLADRATLVTRSAVDVEGGPRAAVVAVSPDTFARAAFFDRTFADDSLDDLLQRLRPRPSGRIPAIAVGDIPPGGRIRIGSDEVGVDVVARAKAFPGERPGVPLLVVSQSALERAGISGTTELWVRGDPEETIPAVQGSTFEALHFVRADEGLEGSSLLPLSTSLDYFRALGLLGGIVTFSGVVLYLMGNERQRRLAFVMTRRMGLRTRVAVLASTVEVGALLAAGFVIAVALAVPAALVVFLQLDPAPGTPPPALVRLDPSLVVAAGVVCAAVAVVAALGSVWASARRPPGEVMRLVQ